MHAGAVSNDILKVLREIRGQLNESEQIHALNEVVDNLSGMIEQPISFKENTPKILKEIAAHFNNTEYTNALNKAIDYVNNYVTYKNDNTNNNSNTALSEVHKVINTYKDKLNSNHDKKHTELLEDFIKEIEQVLISRKGDVEGFGKVVADISYDPILRMDRLHEWEKMIIYTAWNDKDFLEKLRNKDNNVRKDAIHKLLSHGQKIRFKFPPDLKIYVHENIDNELHFVIPTRETNRPLGY